MDKRRDTVVYLVFYALMIAFTVAWLEHWSERAQIFIGVWFIIFFIRLVGDEAD